MNAVSEVSPFSVRNVRLFVVFRVCFNARFYYPVFAVMFLDFGLTLADFALLNAAWAASIVVLEVPSGALADMLGRRRLLVAAGAVMVVELAVICFIPTGNPTLVFWGFLINRVLSGAAEAAASGADEALAYDSLAALAGPGLWGTVLDRTMRIQALARIVAMSAGGAVYDPAFVSGVLSRLAGMPIDVPRSVTMRFPLYLTLMLAVVTFVSALMMEEQVPEGSTASGAPIKGAVALTLDAGRWILTTPCASAVILIGLVFDSVIRMLVTMNSQYYRLIELPEASFGLIGAALGVVGLFIPRLARRMAESMDVKFNLGALAVLTLCGLLGMSMFVRYFGLIPAMILAAGMYFLNFFVSYYLNLVVEGDRRATVLSFKGLSFNLAYGLVGAVYAAGLAVLREAAMGFTDNPEAADGLAFMQSVGLFPLCFSVMLAGSILVLRGFFDRDAVLCPFQPDK